MIINIQPDMGNPYSQAKKPGLRMQLNLLICFLIHTDTIVRIPVQGETPLLDVISYDATLFMQTK
jgi:hypothetical protein